MQRSPARPTGFPAGEGGREGGDGAVASERAWEQMCMIIIKKSIVSNTTTTVASPRSGSRLGSHDATKRRDFSGNRSICLVVVAVVENALLTNDGGK